jgi:shikimate kinase
MILRHTGASRISDIFDESGEEFFRAQEVRCIDEVALSDAAQVVATGGGLPAIPGMMDRLMQLGVVVYLKATDVKLWMRLSADPRLLDDRPLLRGDGMAILGSLLRQREGVYLRAPITIDTEQLSLGEVTAMLVAQIGAMEERPGLAQA